MSYWPVAPVPAQYKELRDTQRVARHFERPSFSYLPTLAGPSAPPQREDNTGVEILFRCSRDVDAATQPGFPEYCASVTGSSHVTCSPACASCMATCSMPCSAVAPCQCFSPGGIHTVSPARISRLGPPQVCT